MVGRHVLGAQLSHLPWVRSTHLCRWGPGSRGGLCWVGKPCPYKPWGQEESESAPPQALRQETQQPPPRKLRCYPSSSRRPTSAVMQGQDSPLGGFFYKLEHTFWRKTHPEEIKSPPFINQWVCF